MAYLLLLLAMQFFWSCSYVAMKLAMTSFPLGVVIILRYGIAAAILIPLAGFKNWRLRKRDISAIIAIGVIVFTLSPTFQLTALNLTQATDTAIIIAFEPMITALLAIIFLGERLNRITIVAFTIATSGVLIMSAPTQSSGTFGWDRLAGNGIFLLSLFCEAAFSTMSRRMTQRIQPLRIVTLMTIAGFLCDLGIYGRDLSAVHWATVSVAAWGSVLFLAICCSVIGYTGWSYLTKRVPINQLTLSLFLQPIIGTIIAAVVLQEHSSVRTYVGALITIVSLLIWVAYSWHRRRYAVAIPPQL